MYRGISTFLSVENKAGNEMVFEREFASTKTIPTVQFHYDIDYFLFEKFTRINYKYGRKISITSTLMDARLRVIESTWNVSIS